MAARKAAIAVGVSDTSVAGANAVGPTAFASDAMPTAAGEGCPKMALDMAAIDGSDSPGLAL